MLGSTRIKTIGAAAGVALAALATTGASAVDIGAAARAHIDVAARAVVPVSVSSASVTVRPTTAGPFHHDGKVITTDPIAAGTGIRVEVGMDAEASAGATVSLTTSDLTKAVKLTDGKNHLGQRCLGLGIDFVANVGVRVGASAFTTTTAKASAAIAVKIGDKTIHSLRSGDIAINNGAPIGPQGRYESIPVVTGADVCLPAEITAGLQAGLDAGAGVIAVVLAH